MGDKQLLGQVRDVRIVDESDSQIGTSDSPLNVSSKIVDSSGDNITSSNRFPADATQLDLFTTFNDILKELKKMNLQLAIMTDNFITNQDVEI